MELLVSANHTLVAPLSTTLTSSALAVQISSPEMPNQGFVALQVYPIRSNAPFLVAPASDLLAPQVHE